MPKNTSHQPLSYYRWAVLLASVLAFILYAYALQSVPPLIPQFQAIFGVDAPTAGLLMTMVVVPGIIIALPAGILIGKYSFRKLGLLSIITVGAGSLIVAVPSNFFMALLGRFIIGIGGGLISVGSLSIVPQWFEHKEMGRAMSVFSVGMPVATVAAFFSAPFLAESFGWQSVFYAGAFASVVTAAVFWAIVRDGPLKGGSTVELSDVASALSHREVWKGSLVWMFFNMAAIGFLTWAPTLFVTFKGLTVVDASIYSSLLMISLLFFIPIVGYASDRTGRRKPFIVGSLLLMALDLYLMTFLNGLPLAVSIVALGAMTASVPPLIMATTAQALPPRLAGVSFSTVTFWQNIGIALIAPIAGLLIGSTHSLMLTFLGLAVFPVIGALVAVTLHTK